MCKLCLPSETVEQHRARHPGVSRLAQQDTEEWEWSCEGHKRLCKVKQGDIIYILGRLLQPFCSHALYRVKVTDLHRVADEYIVIQGALIDFKDSPVKSYAIHSKQLFRCEELRADGTPQPKLSQEDIERIVKAQGVSVGFREAGEAIKVYAWKYLRTSKTKQGKPTSISEKHNLGWLSAVVLMSEEDLASLARTKFRLDCKEESEKVEVTA